MTTNPAMFEFLRRHNESSGGKYDTVLVDLFCKQPGTKRLTTEAGTPQSNGEAEEFNRTISNYVRCMLFESNVPLTYWTDATESVAFILNRSLTRANAERASPLMVLTGKVHRPQDIVVIGSRCQIWRNPHNKSLRAHTVSGYIKGKEKCTKSYKVFLCGDRSVITMRHVTNFETLDDWINKLIANAVLCEDDADLKAIATSRSHIAKQQHVATWGEVKQAKLVGQNKIKSEIPH